MRLVRLSGSNPPRLLLDHGPKPSPGADEALIRVRDAGVITTELGWEPSLQTKTGAPRRDAVPSHEFSGVVAAIGSDVDSLSPGEQIYGMNDWYSNGALAEYCVAPASSLAPKPVSLTYREAASVPISALTAWQALFDHAHLARGERILIHGGAGGVGMFAVQLAKMHGAHVIATASPVNRDFVTELGADEFIDYRGERFEDRAGHVDVVIDTVGGDTLARSWALIGQGGRLVTIVSTGVDLKDPKVKAAFFIVEPNRDQLMHISTLLDRGVIHTYVSGVFPLSQAPDVYSGKARRNGPGKLVISVYDRKQEEIPA